VFLANIALVFLWEMPTRWLLKLVKSLLCVITLNSLVEYQSWHINESCHHKPIHSRILRYLGHASTLIYLSPYAIIELSLIDCLELVHYLLLLCEQNAIFIQLPGFTFNMIVSFMFDVGDFVALKMIFNMRLKTEIFLQVVLITNIYFIIFIWLIWMHFNLISFGSIDLHQIFFCYLELFKDIIIKDIVLCYSIIT